MLYVSRGSHGNIFRMHHLRPGLQLCWTLVFGVVFGSFVVSSILHLSLLGIPCLVLMCLVVKMRWFTKPTLRTLSYQTSNSSKAYWACPRCTKRNRPSHQRCLQCHAQKPPDVTIVHPCEKAGVCWPCCLPRALADEDLHRGHVFRLLHPSGHYADEMLQFSVGTHVSSSELRPADEALGDGRTGQVIFQSKSLLDRNQLLVAVRDLSTGKILVCHRDQVFKVQKKKKQKKKKNKKTSRTSKYF